MPSFKNIRTGMICIILGLFCNTTAGAATFTVTSIENEGANTFRAALEAAAGSGGQDTIVFAISDSITVYSTLSISSQVIIEGGGTTIGALGSTFNILTLGASSTGSWLRDLAIVDSNGGGIYISSNSNTMTGCCVGTDWDNATNRGNGSGMVLMTDMNIIGGSGANDGNVISGNSAWGLRINGDYNQVIGNIIGLNPDGDIAVPNSTYGISLVGDYNIIGGLGASERNTISGNGQQGLDHDGDYCQVLGNYFGFSPAGDVVILNGNNTDNYTNGDYNYFSGNFVARRFHFGGNATGNTLVANVSGMYPDGSGFSGSAMMGCDFVTSASGNFVGLPGGNGNMFANTSSHGIQLLSASNQNNGFFGNTIVSSGQLPIEINGGNNSQPSPVITQSEPGGPISGTAGPNDYIEIFLAEGSGINHGTTQYLGTATANGSGVWSLASASVVLGNYVCAIATDEQNNSSQLSVKTLIAIPTATPTITISPTVTPTLTVSATYTITPSITVTSTNSPTSTVSPTSTQGLTLHGKKILAFPNPAQNQMTFALELETAADVQIELYNLAAEQISQLTATLAAGTQTLVWDCTDVAPGVYLARIVVNDTELGKLKVAIAK
jgi:type IX secretion system substrate protein